MNRRTSPRVVLGVVTVGLVLSLAAGFVTAGHSPNQRYDRSSDVPPGERKQVVEPRGGVTVVSVQKGDMRDRSGELVAVRPNGTVLYQTERHSSYWDVDPSPHGARTVTYVATKWLNESVCGGGPLLADRGDCRRNVVERLNLTTGERTRLYAHRMEGGRWHDVDVINDSHILVGDIGNEAVFLVNTTSGIREWTWTAESDLPITGGGSYDKDWVHLNDVELLDDGRVMVDLRNQDQVAFVNPKRGIADNWTLGSDDDYGVLREQHNPDYIPESAGGPAVVVADSENDRVVEYQRTGANGTQNGTWNRSWVWTDDQMQWPRDADRLPNGNTLVTDTIGDRVFEVNESGAIVWKMPVDRAYEAERLGTGDESAGGPSAARADLESRRAEPPSGVAERFEEAVRDAVPIQVQNGLLGYFFPWWMGFYDVLATFGLVAVLGVWGGLELRWSSVSMPVGRPLSLDSLPSVRSLLLLTGMAVVGYAVSVVTSLL
ncbi:arylsulfotransferase family protein [Halorussus limi]|uniref:Arylsulfotransferase family protein n=1 Tax=Halorussus limi TaxID=2938695 RepID=A0A8U0HTG5_9EURY|nr:arylsulfotransferase family protein [Halorussus limi]UPV74149.1 arylsulfotransferase family protein [Halorussus limi]